MTTRKTIALTTRTFVGKITSLLFNMLSRFVIAFLPRIKSFNFMAIVTMYTDYGAQENEDHGIISWQIDGETKEIVTDFIFLGSKITEDGDCSPEIKRCLLLGRKVMANLDSILKSRGITLPTKVCLVKALVFPVVMYGCES